MTHITRGFKNIPDCRGGKRHQWKKGAEENGEAGICARCGWDLFDNEYRVTAAEAKEYAAQDKH